jgi:hypothetical protein
MVCAEMSKPLLLALIMVFTSENTVYAEMSKGEVQFDGYNGMFLNYKSFVGPANEYDLMGATQFTLLTLLGLRGQHSLLDFGCGSIRAGRLFIPYLDESNYYCIEANQQLLEEGFGTQLGFEVQNIKKTNIFVDTGFDVAITGKQDFQFILAQSIFSHTGSDAAIRLLRSFHDTLHHTTGLALVTFIHVNEINPSTHYTTNVWVYPGVVEFTPDEVLSLIARSGLHGAELTWYHPRQTWYALSHSVDRINWAVAACNNVVGKNVFEGVY